MRSAVERVMAGKGARADCPPKRGAVRGGRDSGAHSGRGSGSRAGYGASPFAPRSLSARDNTAVTTAVRVHRGPTSPALRRSTHASNPSNKASGMFMFRGLVPAGLAAGARFDFAAVFAFAMT